MTCRKQALKSIEDEPSSDLGDVLILKVLADGMLGKPCHDGLGFTPQSGSQALGRIIDELVTCVVRSPDKKKRSLIELKL